MNRPAGRQKASSGGGGSAGARGAILLVVAAVLGIVLLQAFDTDFGGVGGVGVDVGGSTTVPSLGTVTTSVPPGPAATVPATIPSRAPSEVTVLVANGTGIRGLGGQTADALKAVGYNTLTAVDATTALDVTRVQFVAGYESEGRAIALTLGLTATAVQALNSPAVPDTQGANVIVLLGADVARNITSTSTP